MANKYQVLYDNQDATRQLASNLFANTDCNFFSYAVNTKENKVKALVSDAKMIEHCITTKQNTNYDLFVELSKLQNTSKIYDHFFYIMPEIQLSKCANHFGYQSLLVMFELKDNEATVACYASDKKGAVEQMLLSRPDLFFKQKYELLDKGKDIIKKTQLLDLAIARNLDDEKIGEKMAFHPDEFMKNCNPRHYFLAVKGKECNITTSQFKVIRLLAQGQSQKEVASHLGLSVNTVEHYVAKAKERTDCFSTSELLNAFNQSDLILIKD